MKKYYIQVMARSYTLEDLFVVFTAGMLEGTEGPVKTTVELFKEVLETWQLKESKDWDDIPAKEAKFDTDEEAREFCNQLATFFNSEVRLTNNERLLQGQYFKPSLYASAV